ncbi:universal stress protein [Tsukamurella tyrosinosolvens]|uniref:universal stress protein n=1 Tax=Tsukamurella tyrosinosolvens TaxID=57704 RepID=UPI000CA0B6AC|nr:universal stress protein [Tsukamurella tyrosinosolvens]AUN41828.1 hypothetical protein ASU32_18950 [Tsukamurella tyrosinosolvens]
MLVLSAHNGALRSQLDAYFLARLADTGCPIAIIPPAWSGRQLRGRIAVGVDGSAAGTRAAEFAAQECILRSASLHVFHARPYANLIEAVTGGMPGLLTALNEVDGQIAERQASLLRVRHPELTATSAEIRSTPSETIRNIATEFDAIFIGRWKEYVLPEWATVSPTNRLPRQVLCPLVIVNYSRNRRSNHETSQRSTYDGPLAAPITDS